MLGACLLSEPAIRDSVAVLSSGDFYRPNHSTIFAVIITAWSASQPVDPLTITSALSDTGDLVRIGGAPYLHRLVNEVHHIGSAAHYARIVAEYSRRRRMEEIGATLTRAAHTDDSDRVADMLRLATEDLDHLITGRAGRDPVESLLAKMMTSLDLDQLVDLDPLVDGVLFRDSIAWLAGRPGRGKTLVALDIAGSIGTGTSWQGYRVSQGPVCYIIAEGARGIRRRVRAWEHLSQRPMTGVEFLPEPVQSNNSDGWTTLCRAVARRQYALVVLDTQARVTVGLDENSGTDMGLYVERVEQLRAAAGSCVLSLHHTPRTGDHVRGHTAIEGAAQTIIMVVKEGNILTLHNTEDKGGKQKDAVAFDPIHLEIKPVGTDEGSVALAFSDRAAPSVEISAAPCRTMLSLWWDRHADDWVSPTMLVETGISKHTFYTYKRKLIDARLCEVNGAEGKGHRPKFRLPKDPESY